MFRSSAKGALTERDAYIQKRIDDQFRLWLQRASLWGSGLFVVLSFQDYFATPENFARFLVYRIVVSLVLLAGYFASTRIPARYLPPLGMFLVVISAAAIELMIIQFGGVESPYYAGMVLLVISVQGFIPARFRFHLIISIVIQLIYAVPFLATGAAAGRQDFAIINTFLVLISATMLFMRYLSGRSLVAELGLQYDLEQHRGHLEEIVAERTAELAGAIDRLRASLAERQRLQGELLQVQKMESIGRLAGGVAHDFNNILTAIMSFAELSLMKLPEEHPVWHHLAAIRDASEKAAGLTHQLLAFSRKQVLEMSAVDLNAVVRDVSKLLARLIGEDIAVEIRPNAVRSTVRADRGQIEQVIMNLAVNARDAMPTGGRLVIETSPVAADDPMLREFAREECVMLTVSDTGEGMTAEVRERIFDPFFTTKETGKGTGLGLSTVYGIVKQHNGHITVASAPGQGTAFRIVFPLTAAEGAGLPRDEEGEIPRGTETVLVVEDDAMIRELARQVLEPLGYRVLVTSTGDEALAASAAWTGRIHLLLTDVVMPGMQGNQLAEVLRAQRPGIKVLFMSGYTPDALAIQGLLEPGVALVHKPLRPATLLRHIRRVLDSSAEGAGTQPAPSSRETP
jgi:signal transduction histidine kinase/CheY-like chemotaxis protein